MLRCGVVVNMEGQKQNPCWSEASVYPSNPVRLNFVTDWLMRTVGRLALNHNFCIVFRIRELSSLIGDIILRRCLLPESLVNAGRHTWLDRILSSHCSYHYSDQKGVS